MDWDVREGRDGVHVLHRFGPPDGGDYTAQRRMLWVIIDYQWLVTLPTPIARRVRSMLSDYVQQAPEKSCHEHLYEEEENLK